MINLYFDVKQGELTIRDKGDNPIFSSIQTKEDIKRKVIQEIQEEARHILEYSLCGLPEPNRSFDLGKFDYVIDNIDLRLKQITRGIVELAINQLTPKLSELIEEQIRNKIRRSI